MKTYKHQLAEAHEQIRALQKQLRVAREESAARRARLPVVSCEPCIYNDCEEHESHEAPVCGHPEADERSGGSPVLAVDRVAPSWCPLASGTAVLKCPTPRERLNDAIRRVAGEGSLTFAQLRETNAARCEAHYHPVDAWSLSDWCTAVAGEVGELAGVVKNLRRQQTEAPNGHAIPEVDAAKLGAEAADVVIYLDLLCARAGVDLGRAVAEKFNDVSRGRLGTDVFLLPEGA